MVLVCIVILGIAVGWGILLFFVRRSVRWEWIGLVINVGVVGVVAIGVIVCNCVN